VVASRGDRQLLFVNGVARPDYQQVGAAVFSPDAGRLAFAAKQAGKWHVVLDGQPGAAWDQVGAFTFGHDGRRFAYVADKDKEWRVVVDGKVGPVFQNVSRPVISQDSRRIAYRGELIPKRGYTVTTDSKAVALQSRLVPLLAGPTPLSAAWVRGRRGELLAPNVVLAGPAISPEGRHIVYPSGDHLKSDVFVDVFVDRERTLEFKSEGTAHPLIPAYPLFSADGRRFGIQLSQLGRNWLGGRRWFRVFDVRTDSATSRMVFENPRDQPAGNSSLTIQSPVFSPGGDHLAFVVTYPGGTYRVVLDGRDGKTYNEVVAATLHFSGDAVIYLAREGRRFYRVTQPVK
jgi:hypothetical protein